MGVTAKGGAGLALLLLELDFLSVSENPYHHGS